MPTSIFLLLVVALLATPSLQESTPKPVFLDNMCIHRSGNYSKPGTFQRNLQTVLSSLESNSSASLFSEASIGNGPDTVYGRYYCRHDVSLETCATCIQAAATQVTSGCPNTKEALIWYEHCTLIYLNSSSRLDALHLDWFPSLSLYDPENVTDPDAFNPVLSATMNRIINASAYGPESDGFSTTEAKFSQFETLYSLAQCSWDTTGSLCERCLRRALYEGVRCCKDARRMAFFYATCQLRYSVIAPFYDVRLSLPALEVAPPAPAPIPQASSTGHDKAPQGNSSVARSCINMLKIGFVMALTTMILLKN